MDALYSGCTRVHTHVFLLKENFEVDSKNKGLSPVHMSLEGGNHIELSKRID